MLKLVLIIFILVLQNNSSHSTQNKVKCEKPNFALSDIWTHDSCVRDKRFTARPQETHDKDQTKLRLYRNFSHSALFRVECEKLFCKT